MCGWSSLSRTLPQHYNNNNNNAIAIQTILATILLLTSTLPMPASALECFTCARCAESNKLPEPLFCPKPQSDACFKLITGGNEVTRGCFDASMCSGDTDACIASQAHPDTMLCCCTGDHCNHAAHRTTNTHWWCGIIALVTLIVNTAQR